MRKNALPKGVASFNRVYKSYKVRSFARGIHFNISPEYFKCVAEMNCYFCGAVPTNINKEHNKRYNGVWKFNGLDRVDNTQGYVIGNVRACCSICNQLKSNMELKFFMMHIMKIAATIRRLMDEPPFDLKDKL